MNSISRETACGLADVNKNSEKPGVVRAMRRTLTSVQPSSIPAGASDIGMGHDDWAEPPRRVVVAGGTQNRDCNLIERAGRSVLHPKDRLTSLSDPLCQIFV